MGLHGLDPLVSWLAATPLSVAIGSVNWLTPAVQCVHIVAIAALMACMTMSNLRVLGVVGREDSLAGFTRRYGAWIWPALLVLLVSGSVLVVGEPRRELQNKIFVTKMALVAAAAAMTLALQLPLRRDQAFWDGAGRVRLSQAIALASILAWVAIIFAGRWIAYTQE